MEEKSLFRSYRFAILFWNKIIAFIKRTSRCSRGRQQKPSGVIVAVSFLISARLFSAFLFPRLHLPVSSFFFDIFSLISHQYSQIIKNKDQLVLELMNSGGLKDSSPAVLIFLNFHHLLLLCCFHFPRARAASVVTSRPLPRRQKKNKPKNLVKTKKKPSIDRTARYVPDQSLSLQCRDKKHTYTKKKRFDRMQLCPWSANRESRYIEKEKTRLQLEPMRTLGSLGKTWLLDGARGQEHVT